MKATDWHDRNRLRGTKDRPNARGVARTAELAQAYKDGPWIHLWLRRWPWTPTVQDLRLELRVDEAQDLARILTALEREILDEHGADGLAALYDGGDETS